MQVGWGSAESCPRCELLACHLVRGLLACTVPKPSTGNLSFGEGSGRCVELGFPQALGLTPVSAAPPCP